MHPIHLIEGPVGAGKSTFGRQLAVQLPGIHIALDEWFVRLFSPDRPLVEFVPWYMERKDRLVDLIWDHALSIARANMTPILELGLIQRQARYAMYERAEQARAELRVHVLDAPKEVRWQRVEQRNDQRGETFSMVVPQQIFEVASQLWEPPDSDEVQDQRIERIYSGQSDG